MAKGFEEEIQQVMDRWRRGEWNTIPLLINNFTKVSDVTLVSSQDYEWLSQQRWALQSRADSHKRYVRPRRREGERFPLMHEAIKARELGIAPDDLRSRMDNNDWEIVAKDWDTTVDELKTQFAISEDDRLCIHHRDADSLNNIRENLVITTRTEDARARYRREALPVRKTLLWCMEIPKKKAQDVVALLKQVPRYDAFPEVFPLLSELAHCDDTKQALLVLNRLGNENSLTKTISLLRKIELEIEEMKSR